MMQTEHVTAPFGHKIKILSRICYPAVCLLSPDTTQLLVVRLTAERENEGGCCIIVMLQGSNQQILLPPSHQRWHPIEKCSCRHFPIRARQINVVNQII
jgi:hypothetical protein